MSRFVRLRKAEDILDGRRPLDDDTAVDDPTRLHLAVTAARHGDDGAVLFLGPRGDGGIQFFCVRAKRGVGGGFVAEEQYSDEWPHRLLERPDTLAQHISVAAVVSETDEGSIVVVVPFVADRRVDRVEAEVDGIHNTCSMSLLTGAGLAVVRAPAGTRNITLRIYGGTQQVSVRDLAVAR